MSPSMEGLKAGDLTIEVAENGTPPAIAMTWRGKSNDRFPRRTLGPFFTRVLDDAQARRLPVEMHFSTLEHFNSSTITSVIELIQEARSKSVRLVIHYDGKVTWQKVTFEALRVFVKNDGLLELRAA
jgi:hypothetical protein